MSEQCFLSKCNHLRKRRLGFLPLPFAKERVSATRSDALPASVLETKRSISFVRGCRRTARQETSREVEHDRNRSFDRPASRSRVVEFCFSPGEGRLCTFLRLNPLPQRELSPSDTSRFIGGVYFTSAFRETLASRRAKRMLARHVCE